MTNQELINALSARLKELFKGYSLLNKSGVMQEVRIFSQYIPQPAAVSFNKTGLKNYDDSDYDSNFPCVVIQSKGSAYQEERMLANALHKVRILIGIYDSNSDCQGWRDIANIEDRIINTLLVERVIGLKYRLEMPVVFRYVDADTWPIYFGEIELNFAAGRSMMRHDYIHELSNGIETRKGE